MTLIHPETLVWHIISNFCLVKSEIVNNLSENKCTPIFYFVPKVLYLYYNI